MLSFTIEKEIELDNQETETVDVYNVEIEFDVRLGRWDVRWFEREESYAAITGIYLDGTKVTGDLEQQMIKHLKGTHFEDYAIEYASARQCL